MEQLANANGTPSPCLYLPFSPVKLTGDFVASGDLSKSGFCAFLVATWQRIFHLRFHHRVRLIYRSIHPLGRFVTGGARVEGKLQYNTIYEICLTSSANIANPSAGSNCPAWKGTFRLVFLKLGIPLFGCALFSFQWLFVCHTVGEGSLGGCQRAC